MNYSLWSSWVVVFAAVSVTAAAAVTDFKCRRIPNVLTITAFALGLLFRIGTGGLVGFLDAGLAFAVGFGTLFVLWVSGGGGAGDVKLMGALSVWIGFSLTLSVLVLSVVLVGLLTAAAPLFSKRSTVVASTVRPGDLATAGYSPGSEPSVEGDDAITATTTNPEMSSPQQPNSRQRVTVAFAIPLALATWIVLGLDIAGIPLRLT
ncbi:hypothetical protein GC176_08715 [bacterium]|nr:hypothetical protein [bacterium]